MYLAWWQKLFGPKIKITEEFYTKWCRISWEMLDASYSYLSFATLIYLQKFSTSARWNSAGRVWLNPHPFFWETSCSTAAICNSTLRLSNRLGISWLHWAPEARYRKHIHYHQSQQYHSNTFEPHFRLGAAAISWMGMHKITYQLSSTSRSINCILSASANFTLEPKNTSSDWHEEEAFFSTLSISWATSSLNLGQKRPRFSECSRYFSMSVNWALHLKPETKAPNY